MYKFRYYKLIEDLNFFRNVFKTPGFFYRFLTINLLFYLIVLLLSGLLCNIGCAVLLEFVLPGHSSILPALNLQPAATLEPDGLCGNQRYRRELLMIGIMVPETC